MKQPDPHTSTREQTTQFTLSIPCPADANPKFREVWEQYDKLLRLLAYHPAMSENLQQTFMTPAKSKNKVYFMYASSSPFSLVRSFVTFEIRVVRILSFGQH